MLPDGRCDLILRFATDRQRPRGPLEMLIDGPATAFHMVPPAAFPEVDLANMKAGNVKLTAMDAFQLKGGLVHNLPNDLGKLLMAHESAVRTWASLTTLARNEWICWIESAKQKETRERRIRIAGENLSEGKRRPCCWPGCPHRVDRVVPLYKKKTSADKA
jgi:hypothetical protein